MELTDIIFMSHDVILGEFGVVYKGYIKKGVSGTIRDTVAVKTLKGKSMDLV